ncbi:hypothetical protein QR680_016657 [Steinernema hermaphroditum]|uniref:Replication protein A subunit n=1 Tax=Steinernema hermaphroditum TaxID=289476 RepID=A0AA39LMP4_9BILA|nr:hypothetical protein QR680_016657 [Steinernema hermaphroditum]
MGKATLTSQFFAAVRDTGKPKLPALLVVLALREIEHKSFQVRLYDGAEKYSGCSTTKDIYTQLCEKKLNSEVPFVIRVDDVVIKDEFLPEENRMLRMVFIKKGAILKCQAPDEAYEIVRESQLRSQKRLEDSVDHHQIENMEPRAQCAQERVAHEQPGPSFSSFAQRPKAAITPRKTPLKNQVTPEKTGGSPVTPIAFLTPHVKGYKLCGLAHSKSNVMPITTEKRIHDRVFSFTLTDGNIDEIKISAFDDLADYYHRIIENDKMYYVKSTGKMSSTMREVNPQYNNTNTAYEITLKERNMIEDCHNAEKIVRPPLLLNRVMVSELSGKQEKHVDVLGIVTEISEIHMVTIQKTGREVWKRTVTLLDETNTSVHLLLWGNEAEIFPENAINKALAVQHAIVKEWNGNYSLQVMGSTKLEFDPHTRVAVDVKSWFENRNPHSTPVCISEMSDFVTNMLTRDLRTIGSMSNLTVNSLSEDSRGTYFTIVGSIIDFKRNSVCYKACVNNDCRKKVVETQEGSGMYRCETCDLSAAAFKYITLLSFLVADCTGVHWVSMFGDQANKLLKVQSSDELGSMSLDELNGLLDSILFHPMTFRMRAKVEYFNDTENIKWHCFEASTVHSAMFLKVLRDTATKVL